MNNIQKEVVEKLINSVEWSTITIDKDVYKEMQQDLKRFKTMVNLLVTNDFPYNYLRGQSYKELIKRFDSWIEEFAQ